MTGTPSLGYTIPELCAHIGISRQHFYNLSNAGRGPRITRIGRRIIIQADDARLWFDALRQATPTTRASPPRADA